ncbi:hypothetical protein PGT21_008649 [Puccinia graminis f. sp. tritici]|uniref:ADP/ATP carrier protein n=1 Tax=Puccinia graminis f. sp. tritici TaxID=56615 RepID=A0A5B0NIB3_PUCGR|nr:hypothetical protein PGTUg99_030679 [Puccinia graminis f. sp. tritici]KAA1105479.1 hypothetical protein PGT21_008649 [Puccinia graminis f. sp. tritici]
MKDSEEQDQPASVNLAHLPAITQATSAAIGSVISNAIVYPLDLVTTRMQTRRLRRTAKNPRPSFDRQSSLASQFSTSSTCTSIQRRSKDYETLIGSFRTIIHQSDERSNWNLLLKFYDGILVDSIATLINSFIYFYIYTNLNKLNIRYKKHSQRKIGPLESALEEILLGSLTGIVSKFFTCPLNNITIRLQTCSPSKLSRLRSSHPSRIFSSHPDEHQDPDGNNLPEKKDGKRSDRFLSKSDSSSSEEDQDDEDESNWEGKQSTYISYLVNTVQSIYDDRGYRGFWSGFGKNCILTLNPSLTLYLTKLIKHLTTTSARMGAPGGTNPEGLLVTFLNSAIASSLSTMITYPLMLSKTLIQTSPPSAHHQRQLTLLIRYRRFGLLALYTGLQAKLLKVFVGQGITMSIKSQIETLFVSLSIFLNHYRRRLPQPS